MEADRDALAPHLEAGEEVTAVAAGQLLGPAVARGLDVGWGRVIGPEPSVLVVVTDRRVVVVRRHAGGRLDGVLWAAERPVATPQPAITAVVVSDDHGGQVVFRPTDPTDLDRLGAAIPPS